MNDLISRIPLVRFTVPIILGILSAYSRLHIGYAIGLLVLGVLMWIAATFKRKIPIIRNPGNYFVFALLFIVMAISWINTSIFMPRSIAFQKYDTATVIVEEIKNKKRSVQLTCRLIELSGNGSTDREKARVIVYTKDKDNIFKEGDMVMLPSKFTRIENIYENSKFDYASYMEARGIIYSQFVMPYKMKIIGHRTNVKTVARNIQQTLVTRISESYFISTPAKQFLITTLLGDSSYLDKDLRRSFSSTGLSHILAVSGLHAGIIFFLMTIILYPLRMYRKTRYAIIMIAIVMYAFITGLSPSVIRATVMALFLLVSALLYRRNTSLNALFGSAVLILMFNPLDLFNIGFQLSYLAVASILLMSGKINPFAYDNKILYKVGVLLSVSLAATIGTCALSVYYFKIFPVSFLVTNIIVVPALPLIFGLGIIYMIFPSWFIGNLFDAIYKLLIGFVDFINTIPFSSVHVTIDKYQVLIYYLLLSVFVLWWYFKKKTYLFSFLIITGIVAVYYLLSV